MYIMSLDKWNRRLLLALILLGCSAYAHSEPVIEDVRDPDVVCDQGSYYLTVPFKDSIEGGYNMFTSENLLDWRGPREIFRRPNETWPSNIYRSKDGLFYLYYVEIAGPGVDSRVGDKDVGVAVSRHIQGPYEDRGIILNSDYAYIDPQLFDDNGTLYLVVKERLGYGTGSRIIILKMLDPVAIDRNFHPKTLIEADMPWEGRVVEQPYLVKREDIYYLLYSGGSGKRTTYALGSATSRQVTGPYKKQEDNPFAMTDLSKKVIAPGAISVIRDRSGHDWAIYRQKIAGNESWKRNVTIDRIYFQDGIVRMSPTAGAGHPRVASVAASSCSE